MCLIESTASCFKAFNVPQMLAKRFHFSPRYRQHSSFILPVCQQSQTQHICKMDEGDPSGVCEKHLGRDWDLQTPDVVPAKLHKKFRVNTRFTYCQSALLSHQFHRACFDQLHTCANWENYYIFRVCFLQLHTCANWETS